ncbi:DUF4139 domain-containing protein [Magnetospirillum sulfuroxidans]|uniref:DUF4139 domain-containing protein n=1 Tax=Magnetospirillum sulfuroxidans TaxID=611300 RepID=A0ABS5IG85_9PROT|nr:DUF4139 domain-containing protein [Magnetospirillum sulfuroxidans]MBR9972723.1 DUF4139 domain-containing protein [Magnetospirillum sulfuroxidans]
MPWRKVLLITIAASPLLAAAGFADTLLGRETRTGLTLTVTQEDVALVRDRRTAAVEAGAQSLIIEPVPRQAQLGAIGLSGSGISVRSQHLDVNGIDANSLLAEHRGKEVTVVWRHANGSEREERATVLVSDGVPVFRVGDKVVSGQPERVIYDALPPHMQTMAAYRADIVVDKAGKHDMELSYLTHGLSWQPAYVVEIEGNTKAVLSAWAELRNASGGDFSNARIRILAGDINRNVAPQPRMARMEKALMATAMDAAPSPQALGPYHLYSLPQPLSLRDGQALQVPLLPPTRLNVERQLELPALPSYVWNGRFANDAPLHPDATLILRNTADQPLPGGPARLFLRDGDGGLALVGEDSLPMVPAGAPFRLTMGKAFDVTAKRVQTDVQKVAAEITETAWEVRLNNAGDAPVKVRVGAAFAGEWLVLEESLAHDKTDAMNAVWTVPVAAKGETVLRYRVRIKP